MPTDKKANGPDACNARAALGNSTALPGLRLTESYHDSSDGAQPVNGLPAPFSILGDDVEKKCNRCGIVKPVDQFSKHKTCADGINTQCRQCMSERSKAWAAANKEKASAGRRKRWEAYREEHGITPRPTYTPDELAERKRASNRASYRKHHDKAVAYNKTYQKRAEVAARHRVAMSNTRAKKYGVPGTISLADWTAVLEAADHKCLACGTDARLTIDHVIPMSLGGPNTKDNLQPLCLTCNIRKLNQTIDYRPAGS